MIGIFHRFNIQNIRQIPLKFTIVMKQFNKTKLVKSQITFSKRNVTTMKQVYMKIKERDTDLQNDQEEFNDTELDNAIYQHSVRHILNKCPGSPLTLRLDSCASVQELFDIISTRGAEFKHYHVSKAVLVLWDIQMNFYNANNIHIVPPKFQRKTNVAMRNYIEQLTNQAEFNNFLKLIEVHCFDFDHETISCIVLYLNYIGVNINHSVIQKMLDIYIKIIDDNTSLTSLSRVLVAIFNENNTLRALLLSKDIMEYIEKKLDTCEDANEFKLLTVSLTSCSEFISKRLLNTYKIKLEQLLEDGIIKEDNYQTILKIILFLNQSCWENTCLNLLNRCILLLKNVLDKLVVQEMLIVSNILFKYQEPASILNQVQQRNLKLYYQMEEELMLSLENQLKLLDSIIRFSNIIHKLDIKKILKGIIPKCDSEISLNEIYKIILTIKLNDKEVINLFWKNFMEYMEKNNSFKDVDTTLKACNKLLNCAMVLDYRNREIENALLKQLQINIESGFLPLIPSKFAMAVAFLLPYSTNNFLLKNVIYKIEEVAIQLNSFDYFLICKGLHVALETVKTKHLDKDDINFLNNILNYYVDSKAHEIKDIKSIISIVKGSIYRSYNNYRIEENMFKAVKSPGNISSSFLKSLLFCLASRNILLPKLMDRITEYVVEKNEDMMGFNVSKILHLVYILGYNPNNSDSFLSVATDIIIRDQERLTGLTYLQALLALCFFNKLPDFLIKQVFSVRFLEKLDLELKKCSPRDMYPLRVRTNLLHLNRAVCLEYPESNIPWFHQKFLDEETRINNLIHSRKHHRLNINEYILELVKNRKAFEENVRTPYGYFVDFVIHLDNNNNFTETTASYKKLAVLLHRPNHFTRMNVQLKGPKKLKIRHLELLGYDVAEINFNIWSKLLTTDEKLAYLSNVLLSKRLEKRTSFSS